MRATNNQRKLRTSGGLCPRSNADDHLQALQQDADSYARTRAILFRIAIEPRGKFRFASVNQAFLTATGFNRKQIVRRLVLKHCRRAVRMKTTARWEETAQHPNGLRQVEMALTPMFDDKGRAAHLAGVVHDITFRKNVETALHESEERY